MIIAGTADEAWVRLPARDVGTGYGPRAQCGAGRVDEWTRSGGDHRVSGAGGAAGYPVRITEEHEAPAVPPPRLVVVQRGETALAEQLRTIAGPSVPVIWDRRDRDRRAFAGPVLLDRRRQDRRHSPPTTWGALRFLVVHATELPP